MEKVSGEWVFRQCSGRYIDYPFHLDYMARELLQMITPHPRRVRRPSGWTSCGALLFLFVGVLFLCASPIFPCSNPSGSAVHVAEAFNFGFNFGGGGQQQGQAPARKERKPDVDYYAELGLRASESETITDKHIKQQYRLLSRQYHPDSASANEDRERYVRIQRAYEVLSVKAKRKMFDIMGEEGLEVLAKQQQHAQSGGGTMNNPLASFFNMGGMMGDPFKAEDKLVELEVDLLDVFQGRVKPLEYRKKCICSHCKGHGAPPHAKKRRCTQCRGQGVVVSRVQIAPGMVQQVQQMCPHCGGAGEEFAEKCHVCHGRRLQSKRKMLAVEVPKGAPEGHIVKFEMEGEEEVGKVPGDLMVKLVTKPHFQFRRHITTPPTANADSNSNSGHADLDTNLMISLKEALLGFERQILHLDGSERVVVRRDEGTVTPPQTVLRLAGKGLPHMNRIGRGDLFVTISFRLPSQLTAEQREAIQRAWPEEAEKN